MNLEKRIRALEARMLTEPVILHFEDGSTEEICGDGDVLLELFCAACPDGNATPEQARLLDLIHRSHYAMEPSGGHMIELIRGALNPPVEPPRDESEGV